MNPVLAIEAVTPVLKPVLTDGLAGLNINVHLFQPRWCYLSFASPHQVVNYSVK